MSRILHTNNGEGRSYRIDPLTYLSAVTRLDELRNASTRVFVITLSKMMPTEQMSVRQSLAPMRDNETVFESVKTNRTLEKDDYGLTSIRFASLACFD